MPCSAPQIRRAGRGTLPTPVHLQDRFSTSGIEDVQHHDLAWYKSELARKDSIIASQQTSIGELHRQQKAQLDVQNRLITWLCNNYIENLSDDEQDGLEEWSDHLITMPKLLADPRSLERVLLTLSSAHATAADPVFYSTWVQVKLLRKVMLRGNKSFAFTILRVNPALGIQTVNSLGLTSLMLLSEVGDVSCVRLLLSGDFEVDVNQMDVDEKTALWHAADCGHADVVELLLQWPSTDPNLSSPLAAAVRRGYRKVARLLIHHPRVQVNCKNEHGRTPLMQAVLWYDVQITLELLRCPRIDTNDGYDDDKPRFDIQNPTMAAYIHDSFFTLLELLDHDGVILNHNWFNLGNLVVRKHPSSRCMALFQDLALILKPDAFGNMYTTIGMLSYDQRKAWRSVLVKHRSIALPWQ